VDVAVLMSYTAGSRDLKPMLESCKHGSFGSVTGEAKQREELSRLLRWPKASLPGPCPPDRRKPSQLDEAAQPGCKAGSVVLGFL
jgi:hypothetical protein